MEGGAPVSGGDGDGWIQYRIFFANPAETTPRGKELEALSWIPTLDRYDYTSSLIYGRADAHVGTHLSCLARITGTARVSDFVSL